MADAATLDLSLRQRAARVIPKGMWGHLDAGRLPQGYPQFFERGQGCRLWDVDGREYLDFMCSWGPIVLGHHDPDVEAAVEAQRAKGDCFNGPGTALVDLAELLVEVIPHADWTIMAKNGTDATTACVTIARAGTRRRKVLVAKGAYHGAAPWCTPSLIGVTAEDRAHLAHYVFNDVPSLEAAVAQAGDDLAAILVTGFKCDQGFDHEMPTPEFAAACRRLADAAGAALIVDDVRSGFRIDLGGTWEAVGVRPDLSAYSKAIANGYALAAVTGNDRFRDAAAQVFTTGSFWYTSVAMAAALATIRKLRAIDGVAHMRRMGERLRDGIAAQAARHGVALRQTGPAQMPVLLFDDDADRAKGNLFCVEALKRGVYLHPAHTMFLSAAHTADDIDQALAATDAALAVVAARG